MKEFKYSEILKLNQEIGDTLKSGIYNITILSNITIHQIKEIFEHRLRIEGINAHVNIGDYDNIVQDSKKYQESNVIILFWEICNINDGLHYNVELFSKEQLDEILERTKLEINLVLKNLKKTSLIIINKFTAIHFSRFNIRLTNLEELANKLNLYLEDKISGNVRLVDLEKVIANIGVEKCQDMRFYYSSKSLYTINFFKSYSEYIKPLIMSVNGKAKKALIFDCDNTLWKGILGEDGFDNIEMSKTTKDGAIFSEIQAMALALTKQGILIGLCSKNNPSDINEVIKSHPDMQLKDEHITINKSNWSDKVSNLKEMSKELNIGLDSFVFIDDSSFEVNLVKAQLPEITVLQVPVKISEYPGMLRNNFGLFYNLSFTSEDMQKREMYKQQVRRENDSKEFSDIEDYLTSLELKMTIYHNDKSIIPRMSQMSQKTNQFNLTTKRYSEGDITNYIEDENSEVYAIDVSDKFGNSGITGLCIMNFKEEKHFAEIDTFLMSCRIIGRNIEYAFIDNIIEVVKEKNINFVKGKYIRTRKNEQVENFYNMCSFSLIDESNSVRNYNLNISEYKAKNIHYIKVVYEK